MSGEKAHIHFNISSVTQLIQLAHSMSQFRSGAACFQLILRKQWP